MRLFVAPEDPMRLVVGTGSSKEPRLPASYSLDRSDPDVFVLRGPHGTVVARFSARGLRLRP
jgi:hypothetical protein